MTSRILFSALLITLSFAVAAAPALAGGDEWKPVDPAHLALKAPTVERDADAEAIFWEVRVADEVDGSVLRTVLRHYVRIKVFTERGKESQSKIDIPYLADNRITDIAGRTIKPDGSIVELKNDAVFDRTIVKVSGLKLKAKSFAMPAVEPGVIIEYRWREVRNDQIANYLRLNFQRDIPVQSVKYYIKPLKLDGGYSSVGMSAHTFHGETTPFVKEKDGSFSTTMSNVPAFREEPRMPPEYESRAWMLIYYTLGEKLPPDQFWPKHGKRVYETYKNSMKVNDEVKKAAASIIGDAATPEQKIERLFEYCRSKIKNVNDDASGLSAEERKKVKENNSPSDTLKRGIGTGLDIDMLFAALATAAGFEARVAMLANRSDIFFNPAFPDDYFMRAYDIAVRVGNDWKFYDPGSLYVPFGMLRWEEEGQQALISDPKEPVFVQTPLSPPDKSVKKRSATLRLSEDGTLEGDVRIEYTGHFGVEQKEYNDDDTAEEREQTLRDLIKEQMSTAEVSDVRVENVQDPLKPFVHSFHVRVPGYAQRTGKRLFLQPAFFHKGVAPLFPTSERRHPIYFHFPWMEEDHVTIELPAGYALDNADAPEGFSVQNVGKYDVRIGVTKDGRILDYKRSFFFCGTQVVLFPANSYQPLKRVFDELHKRDNHTITLKQSAANSQD
jgi:hypothetical protein